MTVVAADIGARARRSHMRARADTVAIQPAARTDATDMRAGMHAIVAHTRACAHDMPDMAAGANAMAIHARARTDAADVRARTHAMAADMGTDADTQHMDAQFNSRGGRRKQRQGAERSGENFHGSGPVGICTQTDGRWEGSIKKP